MGDTHKITICTFEVVEWHCDCDGACVANTGLRPQSTTSWDGLPPRLQMMMAEMGGHADGFLPTPAEPVRAVESHNDDLDEYVGRGRFA